MINLVEILKDCPQGMELDCTMFENLVFSEVDLKAHDYPIIATLPNGAERYFTSDGRYEFISNAKCVIFPKGKTTWEGFQRPFKDGDIVVTTLNNIAVIRKPIEKELFYVYGLMVDNGFYKDEAAKVLVKRLATEEEKQKLFDTIKANGYKWNSETKTLEKLIVPKFKVGDRIRSVKSSSYYTVVNIEENSFYIKSDTEPFPYKVALKHERDYELAPNKFDISSLIPFESKVLFRNTGEDIWKPAIFGCYMKDKSAPYYALGGTCWRYCIPFDANEHLIGKTDDCDEYYKTWLEK